MELFKRKKRPLNNSINSTSIEKFITGDEVVYYLALKNDNVFKPIVKAGEDVEAGMAIAQNISIPEDYIYSSVCGRVKKLTDSYDINGRKTASILIESNSDFIRQEGFNKGFTDDLNLLAGLKRYHLVDTKGKELYQKYNRNSDEVKTIIYNATSWDSSTLSTPYYLKECTKDILEAVNVLKGTYKNASIFFVFDKDSSHDFNELEKLCTSVHFKVIDKSYGYNMSSLLIKDYFPKEKEDNIIVDEFRSLIGIYKTVCLNEPITEEIISVGISENSTKLIKATIGTKINEIISNLSLQEKAYDKVIRNGAITGVPLVSTEVAIVQGTASIDFIKVSNNDKVRACIKCGACSRVCPMGLYPMELIKHSNKNSLDNFNKYKGMNCIECGLCSYYCPSKISLAHKISLGKSYLSKV